MAETVTNNEFSEESFIQRMYDEDRLNKNLFSYWFPRIEHVESIKIPKSTIIPVPKNVFGAFVSDRVDEKCRK